MASSMFRGGWLRQMIPQKLGASGLAPVKLGAEIAADLIGAPFADNDFGAPRLPVPTKLRRSGVEQFGNAGSFGLPDLPRVTPPQKLGAFGDVGAFGDPGGRLPAPQK